MLSVTIFTPADARTAAVAIAGVRAGATVFLDLEFCTASDLPKIEAKLVRLLSQLPTDGTLGFRLHASQGQRWKGLLRRYNGPRHPILLSGPIDSPDHPLLSLDHPIWLEITDPDQLVRIASIKRLPEALVLKGNESGGWVGRCSAFVLLQHALAKTTLPLHVQGGIGPHTAAACFAAGAAGVVLDDELTLMPEAATPPAWRKTFRSLNGTETLLCGERLRASFRALNRPGFSGATELQRIADAIEDGEPEDTWRPRAEPLIDRGDPARFAWPMGQGIGLAKTLADTYRTIGRLVTALKTEAEAAVRLAAQIKPLAEGSVLAQSHGTRFPFMQGPMTRVSDVAPFASAVADAGALPMIALALLRGPQVQRLLADCREQIPDSPWGVGILGFVPQELRNEQLAVVREVKPRFALIAGGRPEDAAELEAEGIASYLHVPTPGLLETFLARGSRRFVFEGRECGGHVGPLSSFVLWEAMIATLLASPDSVLEDVHVLFAGGIHDGVSAAMISALAAPLAARGAKVGVLMGTAYLFTREAVESGAIVAKFQEEALACRRTVNLETGPGHASRCIETTFAREFYETRKSLRREGVDRREISEKLDALTLGRLRVASKGIVRQGESLLEVDEARQQREGMYMIGEVATLRHEVTTLADFHVKVSEGSSAVLDEAAALLPAVTGGAPGKPCDIAVIGMSAIFPGARDLSDYWENILSKTNSLTEVPSNRWDWRLYFDPERGARDRVYSKWGGFFPEVPFDPAEFGIPPAATKSIEPMQLLALEAVRRALIDAKCDGAQSDRGKTAVIFGASGGLGELGLLYAARTEIPRVIGELTPDAALRMPEWTGDSFPGILLNVIAGRVANRFDCGGANYVIDAACASSLASIESGVRELESGRANTAIVGGVDTFQAPFGYFCFSKTQALSAKGTVCAFDENADGIVISEGVGVLVLKRLADAERDGDRVYAVIKGFGSSSDGRGAGMTVPTNTGQLRALRRAYENAGYPPSTIGLYEAHGTGTALGDRVELESLCRLLTESVADNKASCVVGSVKSLIGHTKGAAGVAGMIKTCLALHHRVLPGHIGVTKPLSVVGDPESPIRLLADAVPWIPRPGIPRRASVSAFGFGGTNFHATLEETPSPAMKSAQGSGRWPCELLVWRAADKAQLISDIRAFRSRLTNPERLLFEIAATHALTASEGPAALAIVASSPEELAAHLDSAAAALESESPASPSPDVLIGLTASASPDNVAFLFPGQGCQSTNALREIALYLPEFAEALSEAQSATGQPLADLLYPAAAFSPEAKETATRKLARTEVAQPVIGALSAAMLKALERLGVRAGFFAGHSYGELTALHAAGVLSRTDFFRLTSARGECMRAACDEVGGAMAAVAATRSTIDSTIAGTAVVVANHNSPAQTVISGPREALESVLKQFESMGIASRMLPVAGAFHSPLMDGAQRKLAEEIRATAFQVPTGQVFSNATASPYPTDPAAIQALLSTHMLSSVEFVSEIEAMAQAGARVFVEVGPRQILTGLVEEILKDRPEVVVIPLDPQRGTLRGFLRSLGRLATAGIAMDLTELFVDRWSAHVETDREPGKPRDWLLGGGGIRRKSDAAALPGTTPLLNLETAAHTRSASTTTAVPAMNPPDKFPSVPPTGPLPADAALQAYAEYQETMRQFLAVQEQVMKQFLNGDSPATPGTATTLPPVPQIAAVPALKIEAPSPTPTVSPAPAPTPIAPPAQAAPVAPPTPAAAPIVAETNSREAITRMLLDLFSERTGYPTDMLGLEQDLEADLGIDSIKRVEIVGAVQSQLPASLVEQLVASKQDLSKVRTLEGWIDILATPAAGKNGGSVAA